MRRLRSLGLAMALATAAWCLPAAPALAQPVADEVQRLLSAGRGEEALLRAEQALAMAPDDARTQFVLAVVLLELGRDAQALPLFQQLAQQFPELPDPLNNIALLEVRAGRLDAAQRSLESALRNDPGHRAARANLAEVHLMLAAAAWERLAQDAPLEPRLARRLEAVRSLIGPASRVDAGAAAVPASAPRDAPPRSVPPLPAAATPAR
jgi:Flp pilus assembly protein TadD